MNSRPAPVTLKAIVAAVGTAPLAEAEFLLSVDGQRRCARLAEVSVLRADPILKQTDRRWSEMALIRLEVTDAGETELPPDARVRQFELLDAATELPVAAGLLVGEDSARVSYAKKGRTIWLTGLSGAGKSTIAQELQRRLQGHRRVECLDADVVRTHLCKGLGFAAEDRMENVRRLALTARMIAETGAMVLVSAISPYRAAREEARLKAGDFLEVYVNAPLSVCENRDVKGLYKRARRGEIKSFTGIDDPYEPPLNPEIECCTDRETIHESVAKILAAIC